jgi:hypothetical protein
MRFYWLAAAAAALIMLGGAATAGDKIDLKVLYAGNPDSPRTKDFVTYLSKHFTKVGETNYEKFKEEEAKAYDVIIFDWSSIYPRDKDGKLAKKFTGLNSPKAPTLSSTFDRPAVLIGAAGGSMASPLGLKINWL